MSLFKNPLLIILLVLTSFDSFGQGEIVSYSYSGATDLGISNGTHKFEYPSCKGFSISIVFADDGDYRDDGWCDDYFLGVEKWMSTHSLKQKCQEHIKSKNN